MRGKYDYNFYYKHLYRRNKIYFADQNKKYYYIQLHGFKISIRKKYILQYINIYNLKTINTISFSANIIRDIRVLLENYTVNSIKLSKCSKILIISLYT